ncbi:putative oxidoreductase [Oceanihabitans sediminis]|uniref:DoxX family protein n=1 Tax=Oceanihabitans sediminis TaxID=1812012 RepID=A0A368P9W6_9FLAO|nr:DoxX family protein [Oceanihabitans sediminis]RBP32071.1 putative oxidoreductase [Oceanihabitans sediminis]RCU58725.1 DoxX family protein [Oceanihabitans sediminis]
MRTNVPISRVSIHILRIALSGIFLIASANHLLHVEKTAQRIDKASFKGIAYFFGDPQLLVILSGLVMLIAGLLFLIGYKTKWAAMVLVAVLIPITLTIQVGQTATLGPLFKNIAILGGLTFFIMNNTEKLLK